MFLALGLLLIIAGTPLLYFRLKKKARERRISYLSQKYRDEVIVNLILNRKARQGMTEEMLIDSWGQPQEIDERTLKRKTVRILKYGRHGKNRFKSRVTIENGRIVGFDLKNVR